MFNLLISKQLFLGFHGNLCSLLSFIPIHSMCTLHLIFLLIIPIHKSPTGQFMTLLKISRIVYLLTCIAYQLVLLPLKTFLIPLSFSVLPKNSTTFFSSLPYTALNYLINGYLWYVLHYKISSHPHFVSSVSTSFTSLLRF
jgi:hypothetical protein